jgi:mannitol/fructose-specific phosphotransferase system IIA component (Ntr-type)
MIVEAMGHWDGDPDKFCERLLVSADTQKDMAQLSKLKRALEDPNKRERLLDLARQMDTEREEMTLPA